MTRSILDRIEAALAGSLFTLAAIWFSGNKQYDTAAFLVTGAVILVWLIKAVSTAPARTRRSARGAADV
jgi:hypothetical protein